MKAKFYYSVPQQIRSVNVLSDASGNIIYVYPKTKLVKNLPRITICSILDGDTLSFGYSTCSHKDTYVKKLGQHIARQRAELNPYKKVTIEDKKDIHVISDAIVSEIFELETKRIYQN